MAPNARQPEVQKLKFKEALTGHRNTAELLKRLKALAQELASLDQELVDPKSLDNVRKDLITHSLLLHKDKAVKAVTACCLADLLRLYAPDAPYTGEELRDIFQFFFRQIKNLGTPNSPNATEYYYLIESLANVKSVVLVCDLPQAEDLMSEVFKALFDVVKPDTSKSILPCFVDILTAIIDEAQTLPQDVTDTILAQFLPKNVKANPAALQLAVEVCNGSADRLQRYVCQYFTEVIVTAGNVKEDEEDEEDGEMDTEGLQTAHNLIKQLNKTAPGVLTNVIPLLETELQTEKLELRIMATKTLGSMFAEPPGKGDLAQKYPSTWKTWLGRSKDKHATVRLTVLESLKTIWTNHPGLATEVQEIIKSKLVDPDEKIRAASCTAIAGIDYENALHSLPVELLEAIAERVLDRKPAVQNEAINSLARLYNLSYMELEDQEAEAVEHFAWIPQRLFKARMMSLQLKSSIDQMMLKHILPLPSRADEDVSWTDRLIYVFAHLQDQQAQASFLSFTNLQNVRPTPYERFIEICEKYNGGIMDKDEEKITTLLHRLAKVLSNQFPEPGKAETDLNKFAKMNDGRLYKLLRVCADPQTDLKSLLKNYSEYLRRLEQSAPNIQETMRVFASRISLLVLNRSSIPILLKKLSRHGEKEAQSAKAAQTILSTVTKHCPALYQSHSSLLVKGLAEDAEPVTIETCLSALSAVARSDASALPTSRSFIERITHLAEHGTPLQAKHAATIMAHIPDNEPACASLVSDLASLLSATDGERLVAKLTALSSLAKHAPESFENEAENVVGFVLKDVLLNSAGDIEMDGDGEDSDAFIEDADLSPKERSCLAAIKLLTNRCIPYADKEDGIGLVQPVLKLFWSILDITDTTVASKHAPTFSSRLRLHAAFAVMRLAKHRAFDGEIQKKFAYLSYMAFDPSPVARNRFLVKLTTHLRDQKLENPQYKLIIYLTAHDPDEENRVLAKQTAQALYAHYAQEMRIKHFDGQIIRFIHLLAHHPDFSKDTEDLVTFSKYLELFFDITAKENSISLLHHLCTKLKTVRDVESEGHSEYLYTLSDLAQHLLRTRAKANNWTIPNFPGKIKMPGDIFRPLPTPDVGKSISKTSYISDEAFAAIDKSLKDGIKETKKPKAVRAKKTNGEAKPRAPRKRKSSPSGSVSKAKRSKSTSGKAKRKSRNQDWKGSDEDMEPDPSSSDHDDEDEDEEPEDEDEDMEEDAPPAKAPVRAKPKPKAAAIAKAKKESEKPKSTDSSPARKSSRKKKST